MSNFQLDGYIDVAERIAIFRGAYPDGSLQCHDLQFLTFGGKDWVVYTAAAYRHPEDIRPGIGTAWEPVPGATPYTRNSELQNAETAAWGRAIVAALASDTKKIASADEVRMRQEPPVKASPRDFIAEAEALVEKGNKEALQDLYKQAVASRIPQSQIDLIILLGQGMSEPGGNEVNRQAPNQSKA